MASSTSDLIVRLSLDTTNFEGSLSKFEGQMTKLQTSCTNATTGITNFKQVTTQLQTSAQTLTDKLAAQKQKVADLEAAYEKSKAETGENSEETKKLATQLEQAKQKVSQTEQALKLVTQQLKLSQNGFYQLGTQLENIGAKLEPVGKKVSDVGKQLTTNVTTPIVALGTACITTFTSFDDSLKTVQATMGLVAGSSEEADRQIALLNRTAQDMGASTRYSASEVAEALNYLALAGYSADEACAALPQVLALAQAGGLDLAYASDLATDAMAALGLSMDELGAFSDQMAVTAQKSNTSVGQLGEAILTVGGTAKQLEGGTAELNAELGILANRGIKGAEGGTHLRNVILSLTKPTDKAAAQLEKLGVSVYDSSGNMRSMNDIMMDLNAAMDGMTAEQKQNIISTIFNKTDLAAVTALLDGCGDEFNELIGYIDDSEGAAQQMADTMESGLGGSFRTLKSAVEGLAIAFGERLAPYVQKAVEKITSIVRWLTNLDDKTKDTIIKVAAVAAAIGPVLMVGGKLITGIGKVIKNVGSVMKVISGATKVTGLLGKAMTALTGPVGIVIAVIAVLVAAFISLYKNNEEFRDKVNAIWEQIKNAFEKVKDAFVKAFQTMQSWFEPIKASLQKLWGNDPGNRAEADARVRGGRRCHRRRGGDCGVGCVRHHRCHWPGDRCHRQFRGLSGESVLRHRVSVLRGLGRIHAGHQRRMGQPVYRPAGCVDSHRQFLLSVLGDTVRHRRVLRHRSGAGLFGCMDSDQDRRGYSVEGHHEMVLRYLDEYFHDGDHRLDGLHRVDR